MSEKLNPRTEGNPSTLAPNTHLFQCSHDNEENRQCRSRPRNIRQKKKKEIKEREESVPGWERKGKHPSLNRGLHVTGNVVFPTMAVDIGATIFSFIHVFVILLYDSVVPEITENWHHGPLRSLI